MSRMTSAAALATFALSLSGVASAHVDLTEPPMRGGDQKVGPCGGQMAGMRTDFVGGETITVVWRETIDHPGSFVISFDPDGDDFDGDGDGTVDFPAHPNAMGSGNGNGDLVLAQLDDDNMTRTVEVTLPDVDCDNCTLQMIQLMTDKQPNQMNPTNHIYFRCADIAITSSGGGGDVPTDDTGGAGGGDGFAPGAGGMGGDPMVEDDGPDPEGMGGGPGTDVAEGMPVDTTGGGQELIPEMGDGAPPAGDPSMPDESAMNDTEGTTTEEPGGQMDLVAPPTGDDVSGGGAAPTPTTPGSSTAGVGGTGTAGDTAGSSTTMPGAVPTGADPMMSDDSDDGGCAVAPRSATGNAWAMALVTLILGAGGLRRRR